MAMAFDHVGVSVADLARSEAFYRTAFAFTQVEHRFALADHGLQGVVLTNDAGARIELFAKLHSQPTRSSTDPIEAAAVQGWFQTAFRTNDVKAGFARVVAAGALPVRPPFLAPDGLTMVAFVADPDGNLLELVERPA